MVGEDAGGDGHEDFEGGDYGWSEGGEGEGFGGCGEAGGGGGGLLMRLGG